MLNEPSYNKSNFTHGITLSFANNILGRAVSAVDKLIEVGISMCPGWFNLHNFYSGSLLSWVGYLLAFKSS